jgi:DNA repair protein RadC
MSPRTMCRRCSTSCSSNAPRRPNSERCLRGSSALSGVEHLTLLVGKESVAFALIRHFGSLKALSRASFQEIRQFLPRRQAEAVVAALSMSAIAETEHARAEQLDNPESIYRARTDMKLFNQEVLRVILLDTRYRHISTVETTKVSINESSAYPRDIFRPVIARSAFDFVLVHNHPSGVMPQAVLCRKGDTGVRNAS